MSALQPKLSWHQKVACIGARMHDTVAPVECPVRHIFERGMYIREISIPAGVIFVGRPHRFGHRIQMVTGRCRLITEHGEQQIEPPYEFETYPGFLMVLETFEPHVGRTFHPNPDECRDVELMERLIFHPPEEMLAVGRAVEARLLEQRT